MFVLLIASSVGVFVEFESFLEISDIREGFVSTRAETIIVPYERIFSLAYFLDQKIKEYHFTINYSYQTMVVGFLI